MTCTRVTPHFLLLIFVLLSERCWSAATLSVKCLIINLEYVECKWYPKTLKMNYTFSSAFKDDVRYEDCPEYILDNSYTIGCKIPLKNQDEKFHKVYTNISTGGNQSFSVFESLRRNVQLNPPYNLSMEWLEQSSTLVLQWKNSTNINNMCLVYMVHQQTDTNTNQYINVTETSYTLPLASRNKCYTFRVRSTLSHLCGSSNHWSNWSAPLTWDNRANINISGWWKGLFVIMPIILLPMLVWLLFYCERNKIILLPIVPDPSKNLQDLFYKHNGNVESWVHISKELKEAFEPDYTESACDVCEVTPPCDAEATPTSQADTCDQTNTEEEPEKQLSS